MNTGGPAFPSHGSMGEVVQEGMTREQVMKNARSLGLIVEPCRMEEFIAVRSEKVPEGSNECMRLSANGSFFTVSDGYYWQIGTVEDVANYVQTLKAREQ